MKQPKQGDIVRFQCQILTFIVHGHFVHLYVNSFFSHGTWQDIAVYASVH